jgi:hypothetical protein
MGLGLWSTPHSSHSFESLSSPGTTISSQMPANFCQHTLPPLKVLPNPKSGFSKFWKVSLTSQWVHKYKTFDQQTTYWKVRNDTGTPCSEDYTLLGCDAMQWNLPRPLSGPEGGGNRCPQNSGATSLEAVIITVAVARTSHLLAMCAEGLISGTFLTPGTVITLQMLASSCQQRTWTTRRLSTISLTINYLMRGNSPHIVQIVSVSLF